MEQPIQQRIAALAGAAREVLLPDILLAEDLARVLRITPGAARALIRSGQVPARKIGRRWLVSRAEFLRQLTPPDASSRFGLVPPGGGVGL